LYIPEAREEDNSKAAHTIFVMALKPCKLVQAVDI
jgi:hypothetical protein